MKERVLEISDHISPERRVEIARRQGILDTVKAEFKVVRNAVNSAPPAKYTAVRDEFFNAGFLLRAACVTGYTQRGTEEFETMMRDARTSITRVQDTLKR